MSIIDKIHEMIEDLEEELTLLKSSPTTERSNARVQEIEKELHCYRFGKNNWQGLVKENPLRF